MADQQNILYVQTSNAPERQYSPLVLAQSAKAMGLDAAVYYLGMGLTVLKPGAADEMKAGSFPTVAEMLQKTIEMGITVYVCAKPASRCSAGRPWSSSTASRSSARPRSTTSRSTPARRSASDRHG